MQTSAKLILVVFVLLFFILGLFLMKHKKIISDGTLIISFVIIVLFMLLILVTPTTRMVIAPNLWCDYETKATNQEFINNYKKANINYLIFDPDDRYITFPQDGKNYFCATSPNSVSEQVDMKFFFSLTENNSLQLTILNGGDLIDRVKKEQFFFDAEYLLAECIKDAIEVREIKNSWEK